jgi:hypothetical protein
MEQLYSLIIDATNHLLASMHVVYSLMALVAFVYISGRVSDAVDGLGGWDWLGTMGRVQVVVNMVVACLGAILFVYLLFG